MKKSIPLAMTVKMWPLRKIIPYPGNPRNHPPEQITLLATLLKKHGPDQPIVVDEAGVILKGHGRLTASLEAGLADFPVIQRFGLPDIEKRAMRISDNAIALLSGWAPDLMRVELNGLALAGYDMPLLPPK